jgi:hypothetical protein
MEEQKDKKYSIKDYVDAVKDANKEFRADMKEIGDYFSSSEGKKVTLEVSKGLGKGLIRSTTSIFRMPSVIWNISKFMYMLDSYQNELEEDIDEHKYEVSGNIVGQGAGYLALFLSGMELHYFANAHHFLKDEFGFGLGTAILATNAASLCYEIGKGIKESLEDRISDKYNKSE